MAIGFEVIYSSEVVNKDIPHLPAVWRNRIRTAIDEKLTIAPELFGKPLRRSLKGYRKLRVGDYRVVFRIQRNRVMIFAILHRSVVYEQMNSR